MVSQFVEWLVDNHRDIFQAIKWPVDQTLTGFDHGLNALHPIIVIVVLTLVAWRFSGIALAVFTVISLVVTGLLGLWAETMTTLAMVISAVIFLRLGRSSPGHRRGKERQIRRLAAAGAGRHADDPRLRIPGAHRHAVSVGNVAGVLATIVFAMPPIIRLTSLGIRQVHPELVEAAQAFGATKWQVLLRVQVPLAMPTILAGLNQTIMMALSMVVIAALIGCRRSGIPCHPGIEHPGYRPGRGRGVGHCTDGHGAGPDHPVHGPEKINIG